MTDQPSTQEPKAVKCGRCGFVADSAAMFAAHPTAYLWDHMPEPTTQEPEEPSAWAVYDGTACPTCGETDPDAAVLAVGSSPEGWPMPCPDLWHGSQDVEDVCPGCGNTMRPYDEAGTPYCLDEYHDRPTQEAEKALETLQRAIDYGLERINHDRAAMLDVSFPDALAALRSLRTQHVEMQGRIEELTALLLDKGMKVGNAQSLKDREEIERLKAKNDELRLLLKAKTEF